MADNTLLTSLSDEQIEEALQQYAKVPSIVNLLNGIKEVRANNRKAAQDALEAQAQVEQVKVDFAEAIRKLVEPRYSKKGELLKPILPPPPEGVYNVYLAYREVEEEDTSQPAEEVEITKPDGSKVMETRYPRVKVSKWVVETNKGFPVQKGTAGKSEVTTKRAITVSRRSADNPSQLELVGNFKSGSQACDHLKIVVGADSANRALTREGYFIEPYTGTDFILVS